MSASQEGTAGREGVTSGSQEGVAKRGRGDVGRRQAHGCRRKGVRGSPAPAGFRGGGSAGGADPGAPPVEGCSRWRLQVFPPWERCSRRPTDPLSPWKGCGRRPSEGLLRVERRGSVGASPRVSGVERVQEASPTRSCGGEGWVGGSRHLFSSGRGGGGDRRDPFHGERGLKLKPTGALPRGGGSGARPGCLRRGGRSGVGAGGGARSAGPPKPRRPRTPRPRALCIRGGRRLRGANERKTRSLALYGNRLLKTAPTLRGLTHSVMSRNRAPQTHHRSSMNSIRTYKRNSSPRSR